MKVMLDIISIIFVVIGAFFFLAGTVGLLRFPDLLTRLHAMTKADNVGLGLTAVGLALQADSFASVGQITIVWLLVLLASASSAHLFAHNSLQRRVNLWRPRKRMERTWQTWH